MKKWGLYYVTADYSFWHKIEKRIGLEDVACLNMHEHKPIVVKVMVEGKEQFLDFKHIKQVVNNLLALARGSGDGVGITLNDVLKTSDATMEIFADWLMNSITERLFADGYGHRIVVVDIRETPKYGIVMTDV